MPKTLFVVIVVGFAAGAVALVPSGAAESPAAQATAPNQCVECHARIAGPPELTSRYLDWHFSKHARANVGCEKCHGGDSSAKDAKAAHKGILPSSQSASRLNRKNLPETCSACHREVVRSFIESTHYQRLKESGLGPSCTTCHDHMASTIATSPADVSDYCTSCHNSYNGLVEGRPDIPRKAEAFMRSLARANYMASVTDELLAEAERRKIDVADERDDLRLLHGLLLEARVGWHGFGLEAVQTKVDKAYEQGLRIRKAVQAKLDR